MTFTAMNLFFVTMFEAQTLNTGSIIYDTMILAFLQFSGYLVMTKYIHRIPRVRTFNILLMVHGCVCMTSVVLNYATGAYGTNDRMNSVFFLIVKITLSGFEAVQWTYLAEVFNSDIRGSAYGFCITVSKFLSLIGPYLV